MTAAGGLPTSRRQVLNVLAMLRNLHPDLERHCQHGGCYDLFLLLRTIYPEARPYYAPDPGHAAVQIGGVLYDIRGTIKNPKDFSPMGLDYHRRQHAPHRWSKRSKEEINNSCQRI